MMPNDTTTREMHVRSYEEPLMEYGGYRLHKNLMLYVPPVLLTLGTIGNTLSVVILSRQAMRRMSTYFYLAVLSSADTIVLYVGLLRLWLGELTGEDIRDWNDWSCRIITFLGYTASDFSGWLIIAVTLERYLAVCYPFRASVISSKDKAIKVAIGLLIVLFLINCHFFWTVRVVYMKHDEDYIPQCNSMEPYIKLIDDIWPWVDAFIYSFLPFLAILVLNTAIIKKIITAKRRRRIMSSAGIISTPEQTSASDRDGGKITIMLIVISFTFLATTLPMNVSLIVTKFIIKQPRDVQMLINLRLMMTITELLMYVNHSINFVLYCATGQKFRAELLCLFTRRKVSHQPVPVQSGSSQPRSQPLRVRHDSPHDVINARHDVIPAAHDVIHAFPSVSPSSDVAGDSEAPMNV